MGEQLCFTEQAIRPHAMDNGVEVIVHKVVAEAVFDDFIRLESLLKCRQLRNEIHQLNASAGDKGDALEVPIVTGLRSAGCIKADEDSGCFDHRSRY